MGGRERTFPWLTLEQVLGQQMKRGRPTLGNESRGNDLGVRRRGGGRDVLSRFFEQRVGSVAWLEDVRRSGPGLAPHWFPGPHVTSGTRGIYYNDMEGGCLEEGPDGGGGRAPMCTQCHGIQGVAVEHTLMKSTSRDSATRIRVHGHRQCMWWCLQLFLGG